MKDQKLWEVFLEECVENLHQIIMTGGVYTLLNDYTSWLYQKDIINSLAVKNYREFAAKKTTHRIRPRTVLK